MFSGKWAEKDAVNRILKRSIEDCQPLNTWKFVKYQYEGLNKYQKISEGKIGFDEMWDIDGTYNFYREISVPVTENMKNWYLVFEIGGECEVYVNDIPVGSLDTNHKEILIAENTFGGERFQIRVQATRHEHEYVRSERMNGKSYGYHIFQNVSLISRRREIEQFAYMAKIILEFMECDFLGEEKRLELHEILKEVLYEIDYFADIDTLEKQVIVGRGLILEKIHNCSIHVPFDESLYMGHSHLDLAFKWTYKETYRKMERFASHRRRN